MTMKIDMNKKYKRKDGINVRILCVDLKNTSYPVVLVAEKDRESVYLYTETGQFKFGYTSNADLIEISSYADLEIDQKVLVWNDQGTKPNKFKRHFAGIDANGEALTWRDGGTSFTQESTTAWDNCEAWKEESQ